MLGEYTREHVLLIPCAMSQYIYNYLKIALRTSFAFLLFFLMSSPVSAASQFGSLEIIDYPGTYPDPMFSGQEVTLQISPVDLESQEVNGVQTNNAITLTCHDGDKADIGAEIVEITPNGDPPTFKFGRLGAFSYAIHYSETVSLEDIQWRVRMNLQQDATVHCQVELAHGLPTAFQRESLEISVEYIPEDEGVPPLPDNAEVTPELISDVRSADPTDDELVELITSGNEEDDVSALVSSPTIGGETMTVSELSIYSFLTRLNPVFGMVMLLLTIIGIGLLLFKNPFTKFLGLALLLAIIGTLLGLHSTISDKYNSATKECSIDCDALNQELQQLNQQEQELLPEKGSLQLSYENIQEQLRDLPRGETVPEEYSRLTTLSVSLQNDINRVNKQLDEIRKRRKELVPEIDKCGPGGIFDFLAEAVVVC
jgi:hypothetical protein